MAEESKFKVGDRVISPHFGEGIITGIDESEDSVYPIHVKWTKLVNPSYRSDDVFTLEGRYTVTPLPDPEFDQSLILNPLKKEEWDDKKMSTEDEKFHVGDKVFSNHKMFTDNEKFFVGDKVFSFNFGFGVVENILDDKGNPYPVAVRWSDDSKYPNTFSYFSENGVYDVQDEDPKLDIHPLSNVLDKKTEDAINPSHYKVEGLPESIDIINHLMHKDQYEGFLWGNILKYAYRYGRKGDKAETAGKIAWYANQLKDLAEEGDRK